MKTSILFMCLLAVAYATHYPVGLKTLCENLHACGKWRQCGNALVDYKTDIFVWHCALVKAGVINEKYEVNREKGIKYCETVMLQKNVDFCKKCVIESIDKECKEPYLKNCNKSYCQINAVIRKGVMDRIDCSMYV